MEGSPLGARHAAEIEASELLDVLRTIESKGRLETAHRLLRLASRIFRFGIATGACKGDPAADLTRALTSAKSTPRPAITDPAEFDQLLRDIRHYDGTAAIRLSLEMLALLFRST